MLLSNYNHINYSYLIQRQHEMYKKKRHTVTQYRMVEPCLALTTDRLAQLVERRTTVREVIEAIYHLLTHIH